MKIKLEYYFENEDEEEIGEAIRDIVDIIVDLMDRLGQNCKECILRDYESGE